MGRVPERRGVLKLSVTSLLSNRMGSLYNDGVRCTYQYSSFKLYAIKLSYIWLCFQRKYLAYGIAESI